MADALIVQPTQADIDELRGYTVRKWRKFDNFICVHCQYATLWIAKMEKHQAEGSHPWAYPLPESEKGKLSEAGNEPNY
jgi:hypothetical protein